MAAEVTSLVLGVDATQVENATRALEEFGRAGKGAETASTAVERSTAKQATAMAGVAKASDDAARSKKAFLQALKDELATYGKSEGAVLRYKAAQAGVAQEASHLILQLENVKAARDADAQAQAAQAAAQQQAVARSGAFVAALKEQVETLGLSRSELLAYRAAQLGAASDAQPLIAAIEKQQAALDQSQFLAGLRQQSEVIGKTRVELLQLKAAQLGISEQAAPFIRAIAAQEKSLGGLAKTGKLSAQEMTLLGYQLNDFFVQVASGGNPLIALIQQGSQLNGTFGSIGGSLRAVASIFTLTRVAVGGLAAAVGGLAYAFVQGDKESAAFTRTLVLTGNAAGLTEGRFNSLAQAISSSTGTAIGGTRDTLLALAGSGRLAGDALEEAAKATQLLEKVTGKSADEIAQQFVRAADNVSAFAEESNRAYNYLDAGAIRYVRSLQDQGREQEALAYVLQRLNGRLADAAQNVGFLERAYYGLKNAASEAADALLNVGRDATPEQRLAEINKALAELDKAGQKEYVFGGLFGDSAVDLRTEKAALEENIKLQRRSADIDAERAQQTQKRIEFDKILEQSMTRQEQKAKALADALAKANAAGATDAEKAKVTAAINEKYAEPKTGGGGRSGRGTDNSAQQLLNAQFAASASSIRSAQETVLAGYRTTENELEAMRSAGLTSEKAYYDKKRELIQAQADIQVQALEKENALISAQKGNAAEQVANQQKVADNIDRITVLRNEASSQLTILSIQENKAAKDLADGYKQARKSAQDYLDTLKQQQDREVNGLGRGNKARDYQQGLNQIEDKYTQQRQQADSQLISGQITKETYDQQVQLIDEFQQKALASYDDMYTRLEQRQRDWGTGAAEAINNYLADVADVAQSTSDVVTSVLDGMTDALTDLVTTGKADWKSLGDSIVAEITRIIIKQQIANALMAAGFQSGHGTVSSGSSGGYSGVLSSIIGAVLGSGGGRANGGPVSAGQSYEVNERGIPEVLSVGNKQYLMMAGQNGRVTPLTQVKDGSRQQNQTVVNNFTVQGSVDRRSQQQVAAAAGVGVQRAVRRGR